MPAPKWQPSITYLPGAITQPTTQVAVRSGQPANNDFESGAANWTLGASTAIASDKVFSGAQALKFTGTTTLSAGVLTVSTDRRPVIPGQSVSISCNGNTGGNSGGASVEATLCWYDAAGALIGTTGVTAAAVTRGTWQSSTATGLAPANAATVAAGVTFFRVAGSTDSVWADLVAWNYAYVGAPSGLLYEAVQSDSAKSGAIEPVWPTALGATVVDGGVTWKAVQATMIEWTASPLNLTGDAEPAWPTIAGALINDNGAIWMAVPPVISDINCPNSRIAAIAASKVFVGDRDIVRFCATNNADDWTAQYDAGYLATGLQSATDTECTALGLYRGNLAVFMASNAQIWQVDPDPAAMSFLDQVPGVGTSFSRGLAAVQGDLYFLATLGVRSASISAGTANLEAGDIGTPIDPLVQADLNSYATAIAQGQRPVWEPLGVFVPSAGQYVLCMGNHAWVFSYSPSAQMAAWSEYTFPWYVTDACVLNGDLYVRADNNNVYRLDKEAEWNGDAANDDGVAYQALVRYPYLDFGNSGGYVELYGADALFTEKVVGVAGACAIQIGYDENNLASLTDAVSVIAVAARGEDGFVPIEVLAPSVSLQITYTGDGMWELTQANLYIGGGPRAP